MFFPIILVIHQTSKLVAIWISIDLGFDKSWLLTAHLPFWSWGEARQNAANDELCSLSLSHHKRGINSENIFSHLTDSNGLDEYKMNPCDQSLFPFRILWKSVGQAKTLRCKSKSNASRPPTSRARSCETRHRDVLEVCKRLTWKETRRNGKKQKTGLGTANFEYVLMYRRKRWKIKIASGRVGISLL